MTISRVKFPWPPFFRILIFFDEVFNSVRGTDLVPARHSARRQRTPLRTFLWNRDVPMCAHGIGMSSWGVWMLRSRPRRGSGGEMA